MAKIVWQSPQDLGTVADSSYFEKRILAKGFQPLNFSVISGELPPGVQLRETGLLYGVPRTKLENGSKVDSGYTFTLRVIDRYDSISDKTFTLSVSGIQSVYVESTTIDLGVYFDGTYFKQQLDSNVVDPEGDNQWKLISGRLPPGLQLDSAGLLEGFFLQNKVENFSPVTLGWDKTSWDQAIYDFVNSQEDSNYKFTVEISDGENFIKQTYTMKVYARDLLTADRTANTVDSSKILVNTSRVHLPYVTNRSGFLPEIKPTLARQNTFFAYKFEGLDFDGDNLYFEITSPDELGFDQYGETGWDVDAFDSSEYPMPTALGLDNNTGWYTGQTGLQNEYQKDYIIQVFCRKPNNPQLKGIRKNYIVRILGPVNEVIHWVTDSDLGLIDNGQLSILRLQAEHAAGKPLRYRLKPNGRRIPQGLRIEPDGMIAGRVTFNYTQFDRDTTTFDNNRTTWGRFYEFTVVAFTEDFSARAEKTFTLRVNCVNRKPFENLYLKGFPNKREREIFESLMERQDIFPDEIIYRSYDPYYGKAKDLRFLFLPGINPKKLSTYAEAISKNHYTKTLLFGDIKTATAYDQNLNIQYEVVYLEVIDENEVIDPVTGNSLAPADSLMLTYNKNRYSDGVVEYVEYNPNALGNMSNRLVKFIGIANNNTLPAWMTCPQPDPEDSEKFLPPLGFVRAVVLAYTMPGGSNLIAYRLRNSNFKFNSIPFRFDRYQIDNVMSKNYDIDNDRFFEGQATRFDVEPSVAQRFRDRGSVDYVVSSSFDSIDGQTLDYVNLTRVIDGSDNIIEGNTVIFYQQDEFPPSVNDYWDYIERGTPNLRSAVYRIEVAQDGIINLKLLRTTNPGDIVTIKYGDVYSGQTMFFEHYADHGPVPQWWFFDEQLITYEGITDNLVKEHQETTFDGKATRFISNRDQFADLDRTGKYIKFPKNGVFV